MVQQSKAPSRVKRERPADLSRSPTPDHSQESTTCGSASPDRDIDMAGTEAASGAFQDQLMRAAAATPISVGSTRLTSVASIAPQPSPFDDGDAPQEANGDFNGIDILGRKVKALVQAIDKLQSLGIETKDVPLPKIVVVGDQSAGKSSLIEGISGIKVPRSAGTCTRCPLHITLTPTDAGQPQWSCAIKIIKKYDLYASHEYDENGKPSPLGRWGPRGPNESEVIDFAKTTSKADLEDLIRRAQLACLNPGSNPARYLEADNLSDLSWKIDFSPNVVHLIIKEPHSPSLSFVDLPGIIMQPDNPDHKWLVKFVKYLVKDEIKNDNTLILLACAIESDMANSSASKLVAGCPGATDRCVGVLTKPDRRDGDKTYEDVRKVLSNQNFRVGHGYFVAMRPNQKKLDKGITAETARNDEAAFFAQHPWSTILHSYNDRFGTHRLQIALSQKLAAQIITSLPDISDRISSRLEEVERELEGYPDPPTNPLGHIMEALTSFRMNAQFHIEGVPPNHDFRNDFKSLSANFYNGLKELGPVLKTATPKAFLAPVSDFIDLCGDSDDEVEEPQTPCPPTQSAPRPTKRPKLESPATPTMRFKTPHQTPISKLKLQPTGHGQHQQQEQERERRSFDLLEIRKTLEDLNTCNVQGEVDPRGVDHLRLQCLRNWSYPLRTFLDSSSSLLQNELKDLLLIACSKWTVTDFYRQATQIITTFVTTTMSEARYHAERTLDIERSRSFTMNEDDMKAKFNEEVSAISKKRYLVRAREHFKRVEASTGRPLTPAERERKIQADTKLHAELGPDPFQKEVDAMAKVRAYYRVALFRFLDRIVQEVQVGFDRCKAELLNVLLLGLELGGEKAGEVSTRLLLEDEGREARRVALKGEREKLREARVWLQGLDVEGVDGMEGVVEG